MASTYDLILWGASGYVGQMIAEHLQKRSEQEESFTWAIAGRNADKLEALKGGLGEKARDLPTFVGDAFDRDFLDAMAASAGLIVSTVGPYVRYGEALVAACAKHGTDYCDLTGEILFARDMMARYASQAEQSGARIFHCCGVDSLPSDLGVWYLNQQSLSQFAKPLQTAELQVLAARGGLSGGTIASLGQMLLDRRSDPKLAAILDNPFALCGEGQGQGIEQPDLFKVSRSEDGEAWLAPFMMSWINTRVVHANNALLGYPYGQDFRYAEYSRFKRRFQAIQMKVLIASFGSIYPLSALRNLMHFCGLPKPGQGPSRDSCERGYYRFRILGKSGDGDQLAIEIHGDRDPGYGSTSKMIAEMALCLVQDVPKSALSGGVRVGGAAIAEALIPRLSEHAGVSFTQLPAAIAG